MAYKQKGFPMHVGVSPMKRDTGDVLTKNIRNTSQKGDNAKPDPKSEKKGPAESPEVIKSKRTKVTETRKAEEASSPSGTVFDSTKETQDASDKARADYKKAASYVKK